MEPSCVALCSLPSAEGMDNAKPSAVLLSGQDPCDSVVSIQVAAEDPLSGF
jgi:hypothetical protein